MARGQVERGLPFFSLVTFELHSVCIYKLPVEKINEIYLCKKEVKRKRGSVFSLRLSYVLRFGRMLSPTPLPGAVGWPSMLGFCLLSRV